jgi:poly(ADP-ribose) glycohydrolase ARH3
MFLLFLLIVIEVIMALMDSISLASKFRGCLVGGLLGDCLGAPYEGDYGISKTVLQKYFDKMEGPYFKCMYTYLESY